MGERNVRIPAAPSFPLSMYRKQSRARQITKARKGKVIRSPPERVLIEVSARCPDEEGGGGYKCESGEDKAWRHVSICPQKQTGWEVD